MDYAKFYANERVGLPDFEDATGKLVLLDQIRKTVVLELPTGRDTGQAATSMRILEGFLATIASSTTVLLATGKAILRWLDGSTVRHGVVLGDQSPSSYTLDFSAASPGTYAIYVRFVYSSSDQQNRVFWNPAASPPAEEIDNVATRETATWEATFQDSALSPPGNGEWMKVWEVDVIAGPTVNAVTDMRHFYFEGDAYGAGFAHEWGDGANDRSASRHTYPIADWHLFGQMVRRQLKDIIDRDANTNHVKLPAIDLERLSDEHFGPTAAAAEKGKHQEINVGAADRFWKLHTVDTGPGTLKELHLVDQDGGNDGELGLIIAANGAVAQLLVQQRGHGVAMNVSDYFDIRGADDDQFILRHQIIGANEQRTGIHGSGDEQLSISTGSSATNPGVWAKDGFWTSVDRTVSIWVPAVKFAECNEESTEWTLLGGRAEDHGAWYITGDATERELQLDIDWLPEGAVLNSIGVYWKQSAAGGGSREMRLYATKVKFTRTATGYDASPAFTVLGLKATNNYIAYGDTSSAPYNNNALDVLTCTTNNTFSRSDQEILRLAVTSPDNATPACYVYGVRLNFTFRWVSPFPWS